MAFDFIGTTLKKRRADSLYRQRQCHAPSTSGRININGHNYVNFASNDYLGLAQSDEVKAAWQQGIAEYGAGSGASPLVTGYSRAHQELEESLAESLNREAVLLFNSGFAANLALGQSLLAFGGQMIADKLSHASIIDGALSSKGKLLRFAHNDMQHLDKLISAASGHTLVATEGVFSMDGDRAPLSEISLLCTENNAWLMLDDAHGFGVLGENGMGSVESYQLDQSSVPVLMATFGKAAGTAGAFVAGSKQLIEYLINSARDYIFSTNMPAAQAVASRASIQLIQAEHWRRDKLRQNINYFKSRAGQLGIELMDSDTAIQPVMIGDPKRALTISETLKEHGLWITAIRQPTVAKGTDRLRLTLSAAHEQQDLELCLTALARLMIENAN